MSIVCINLRLKTLYLIKSNIAKLSRSSSSSSIGAELALFSANPTTPTPTWAWHSSAPACFHNFHIFWSTYLIFFPIYPLFSPMFLAQSAALLSVWCTIRPSIGNYIMFNMSFIIGIIPPPRLLSSFRFKHVSDIKLPVSSSITIFSSCPEVFGWSTGAESGMFYNRSRDSPWLGSWQLVQSVWFFPPHPAPPCRLRCLHNQLIVFMSCDLLAVFLAVAILRTLSRLRSSSARMSS